MGAASSYLANLYIPVQSVMGRQIFALPTSWSLLFQDARLKDIGNKALLSVEFFFF
jgi:hypothetical protein